MIATSHTAAALIARATVMTRQIGPPLNSELDHEPRASRIADVLPVGHIGQRPLLRRWPAGITAALSPPEEPRAGLPLWVSPGAKEKSCRQRQRPIVVPRLRESGSETAPADTSASTRLLARRAQAPKARSWRISGLRTHGGESPALRLTRYFCNLGSEQPRPRWVALAGRPHQ